jgi:hypothetical protein
MHTTPTPTTYLLSNINRMQALAIPILGNPVELGDVTNAIR